MPEEVEKCVRALMADPDFEPEDPNQSKEEAAWAVCQARYKERVEASMIILEPVSESMTFVVSHEPTGEVLRFRNAVLVVAETNNNKDTILEEELQALADTLPGRPIDDDHGWQQCVGVWTEASVVKVGDTWGLRVGGLIWADRFPEAAEGVRTGRLKLSIEASALEAECSICGGRFKKFVEYCEHLANKARSGANRILHGLRAVGGGLTPRPAGTGTEFDLSNVYFVASHREDTTMDEEIITVMDELQYDLIMSKKLSYQEREDLPDSAFALIQKKDGKKIRRFPIQDCSHAGNALSRLPTAKDLSSSERADVKRKAEAKLNSKECRGERRSDQKAKGGSDMDGLEEVQAQLEEVTRKYDAAVADLKRVEAELGEQINTLTARVEELTGSLEKAEAERAELIASHRKQIMGLKGMGEEAIDEILPTVAGMTEDAFSLLVAHMDGTPPTEKPGSGGFTPGGDNGDETKKLVL